MFDHEEQNIVFVLAADMALPILLPEAIETCQH